MLIDVVAVKILKDFQLELDFTNGEKRLFDMRPFLKRKPWQRIAAPDLFAQVRVAYGTLLWPGGIDVAPEALYDCSLPLTTERKAQSCDGSDIFNRTNTHST